MNPVKNINAALFALWASAAYFRGWFSNEYSVFLSYKSDWLAICENAGKGDYQVAQMLLHPNQTYLGPSKNTLDMTNNQKPIINIYNKRMPHLYGREIIAAIAAIEGSIKEERNGSPNY